MNTSSRFGSRNEISEKEMFCLDRNVCSPDRCWCDESATNKWRADSSSTGIPREAQYPSTRFCFASEQDERRASYTNDTFIFF